MFKLIKKIVSRIYEQYMKYIPAFVILALFAGILLAKFIPGVLEIADVVVSKIIDGIVFAAPIAIFVVLAPSLAKMMKAGKESGFAFFIIIWFGFTRILAGLWAALFTVLILDLPFFGSASESTMSVSELFSQNMMVLKDLMTQSVFFWSIWIAIFFGILAYFWGRLYNVLQKASSGIETLGDYIEPVIPLLMLLLGAYIYSLPQTLVESVPPDVLATITEKGMGVMNLFGFKISMTSEFGLVGIYVIGSVLIGVGCFIWQGMQLGILKLYISDFSIKYYFRQYWMKVYPLAWSTSSEVVSMPLNMSLIKKAYANVDQMVRKLIIGLGAYMNINGTTMHVILLAGIVAVLVGYEPSFMQLALGVPIIALVGYGVPGIPGELVLFAVPMVKILDLPEPIIALFMALYLALQVGLPDSFRTGANVTDNGIYAVGLDKLYKTKFKAKEQPQEQSNEQQKTE